MEKKIVVSSLGPAEAMKEIVKKLFVFKGRSRRSEYWWGMSLTYVILGVFSATFPLGPTASPFFPLYVLGGVFLWKCILLPMGVRRLHDTGRSGGWAFFDFTLMLVYLILLGFEEVKFLQNADSVAGMAAVRVMGNTLLKYVWLHVLCCIVQLVLIVLMCFDSQKGENKYGKSPKYIEVEA